MNAAAIRERNAQFIAVPTQWPYWPCLPVKHRSRDTCLIDNNGWVTADYPSIVLKTKPTARGVLIQLEIEQTPTAVHESVQLLYTDNVIARYDTVDAMLDDGWEVD